MKRLRMLAAIGLLVASTGLAIAQDEGEEAPDPAEATEAAPEEASDETPDVEEEQRRLEEERRLEELDFRRELGTHEESVNVLKEDVFRSKATLQLLKEIVIVGGTAGARSTVYHINNLGPSYRLESVAYYLDGQSIFAKADPTGALAKSSEIKVFDAALPPGTHTLQVNMVLRGNGFGVFSYVNEYTFKVSSSYAFSAMEGEATAVKVNVHEKKGIGVGFAERPTVDYELETITLSEN